MQTGLAGAGLCDLSGVRGSPPQGSRACAGDRCRQRSATTAGSLHAAIAQRLFSTEKAVSKHAAGIFAKLDLAPAYHDNCRVLAVLAYLEP